MILANDYKEDLYGKTTELTLTIQDPVIPTWNHRNFVMKTFPHDKRKRCGNCSRIEGYTTILKDNTTTAKPVHQQLAKDMKHLTSFISYYTCKPS
jgi:hypothetical protein